MTFKLPLIIEPISYNGRPCQDNPAGSGLSYPFRRLSEVLVNLEDNMKSIKNHLDILY